jgi:hypothetical protein
MLLVASRNNGSEIPVVIISLSPGEGGGGRVSVAVPNF